MSEPVILALVGAWIAAGFSIFLRFVWIEKGICRSDFWAVFFLVLPIALAGGPVWWAILLVSRVYYRLTTKSPPRTVQEKV